MRSLRRCSRASTAHAQEEPYRHWFLQRCLPADAVDPILDLPFPAPDLGGVSGKRELHNATRKYFDAENRAQVSGLRRRSARPSRTSA